MRPRRRRIDGVLMAIALAAILPGAGCNLFEARKPAEGGTSNTVWTPPTTPNIVVENLRLALEAGIFGDYSRAFTDDFTFVPDATDVVQLGIERPGQAVFDGWTRDVETQVAESIRTAATSLDLQLVFSSEQIVAEGRLQKYDYTLTLTTATRTDVYQGQAWFEIHPIPGGEWRIARWEDVITPQTNESWGRLKGRNRQV
ncbi:MAG: hypothetical protein U0167_11270 [bacterium]